MARRRSIDERIEELQKRKQKQAKRIELQQMIDRARKELKSLKK